MGGAYGIVPELMAVNVEIEKGHNESTASVIRKFTKRVQGSGILQRVRGIRYYARSLSKATQKKKTLQKIGRREKYQDMLKSGKIVEAAPGSHHKK